ncbi:hypothetical protein OG21DRAFT_695440 [Imleria badia]|jgi:hypothetical protein|nr:hypothetical protein OG21DRAFT_695440 [Imleria badia]
MQLAGSTAQESEGLSNSQQQQAIPETSAGIDFDIGGVDLDVKDEQPQPPQLRVSPKPGALPRYRWDPKKGELVRLPAADPIPAGIDGAEGDEGEYRGEDDATLVPSEDGHVDMSANARMETEYFSDRGTPRPGTPDEARALGPSVIENQRDH